MKLSFPKSERLKSKKVIDGLFRDGKSIKEKPIMAVYQAIKQDKPLRSGFAVSKKFVPKAVDRNMIKRKMREAYRLNKNELIETLQKKGTQIAVMWLYTGKLPADYREIEGKIMLILNRLVQANT